MVGIEENKINFYHSADKTTTYTNPPAQVLVRLFVVMKEPFLPDQELESSRLSMDSFSIDSDIDPFAFKTTRGPTFSVINTLPVKTK